MKSGSIVHSVLLIIFLSLLSYYMLGMIKPIVIQAAIEKGLASTDNVAMTVAHLITISVAAPENDTIEYEIPYIPENVIYSIEVEGRKVTVCRTEEDSTKCKTHFSAISLQLPKKDFEGVFIQKTRLVNDQIVIR